MWDVAHETCDMLHFRLLLDRRHVIESGIPESNSELPDNRYHTVSLRKRSKFRTRDVHVIPSSLKMRCESLTFGPVGLKKAREVFAKDLYDSPF
eukprot:734502-Prorocentrum_minimum.AAC.1